MNYKKTIQFFNNYNKAILSNVEFFENMAHANTNALEQGDFNRKERLENLTAEQEDKIEIMNEPEIPDEEVDTPMGKMTSEEYMDEDDEHFNKLVDGDFKEIDNGI